MAEKLGRTVLESGWKLLLIGLHLGAERRRASGGARPTTGWVKGEVVVDEYELAVDAGALGGDYISEIGMYEEGTGQRLRVLNEEGQVVRDRILLGKVRIEP